MSLYHILLADTGVPPIPTPPPSLDSQFFSTASDASARVLLRQTLLESASSPGVDRAFSVSFWVDPHNVHEGAITQRICGVLRTDSGLSQWSVTLVPQSSATFNQRLAFALFGTAGANNIQIISTDRFWRGRWTHVVLTYTGGEVNTGFKMYLNGVEDTTATLTGSGTYTGSGDDSGFRFQVSAIATGNGQFTGRIRDLAIWNRVLTSGEAALLFNNDVPVDVTSMSFYATAIRAFWALHTGLTCAQGAGAFNLTAAGSITTLSYPTASSYPYFGNCNAIPGNTRYVSFGSIYQESANVWRTYQRSGTDHVTAGKIIKMTVDMSSGKPVFSTPVDVITNAEDIRSAQAALINGNVFIFSALYHTATLTMTDVVYWESTDGAVGETFGSPVSVGSLLPSIQCNAYSKIIQGPGVGEYMVPVYGTSPGPIYWIGYLKRATNGVWSFVQMYSGATWYNETTILNCTGGIFISVSRRETGGTGLYLMKSTDGNAATWTAPTPTGLGVGTRCMGDLAITNAPGGSGSKIIVIYGDRGDGKIKVHYDNNLADILADPTDWNPPSDSYKSYGNTALFLGYPVLLGHGALAAAFWSDEFSASRADLFFCYGQLQYT